MSTTSGVAIWRKSNSELVKVKWVLLKDPEEKLDPVLLACSDSEISAKDMVSFFVRRWRVEVTFAEVRRHLGVETQRQWPPRQWSDLAIERSTPCLMSLFSIVCLLANNLKNPKKLVINHTAWYHKKGVTFSDVLTAVRLGLGIFQKTKLLIRDKKPLINSFVDNVKELCFLITQAVA